MPEKDREQVVQENKDPETGKVNGEGIRKTVRQQKIAQGEGKARSLKEVKGFLGQLVRPDEKEAVQELSKNLLAYIGGTSTDQEMIYAFEKWSASA